MDGRASSILIYTIDVNVNYECLDKPPEEQKGQKDTAQDANSTAGRVAALLSCSLGVSVCRETGVALSDIYYST